MNILYLSKAKLIGLICMLILLVIASFVYITNFFFPSNQVNTNHIPNKSEILSQPLKVDNTFPALPVIQRNLHPQ